MKAILLHLVVLAVSSAIIQAQEEATSTPIIVKADEKRGVIKADLAGVSIGGSTWTLQNPKAVAALKDLGVKYVRLEGITGDARGLYNPETKTWNWSKLDAEIENVKSIGAKVIADVFYMPRFLAKDKSENFYISPPEDYTAWSEYVERIANHINIEQKYGIEYWEVWNEPSGKTMFVDYGDYPQLYQSTVEAIRKADPSAKVGGIADNAAYPENFEALYEYARRKNLPIDFVSFHWYGEWAQGGWGNPQLYQQYGNEMEDLYRRFFKRDVPVILSEWNLPAEAPATAKGLTSAYMASGFYWLQNSPVQVACYFRPEVYGNTLGSLLDKEHEWRSAGRVFKAFSSMPNEEITVEGLNAETVALASKQSNRISVLASRIGRTSDDIDQKFLIRGADSYRKYKLEVHLEDANTENKSGRLDPIIEREGDLSAGKDIEVSVKMPQYSVVSIEVFLLGDHLEK